MTFGIVVLDPATLSFSKECNQQKEKQENKFGQEEGWRQVWHTSPVPMWELVHQVILDLLKHSGRKGVPVGGGLTVPRTGRKTRMRLWRAITCFCGTLWVPKVIKISEANPSLSKMPSIPVILCHSMLFFSLPSHNPPVSWVLSTGFFHIYLSFLQCCPSSLASHVLGFQDVLFLNLSPSLTPTRLSVCISSWRCCREKHLRVWGMYAFPKCGTESLPCWALLLCSAQCCVQVIACCWAGGQMNSVWAALLLFWGFHRDPASACCLLAQKTSPNPKCLDEFFDWL